MIRDLNIAARIALFVAIGAGCLLAATVVGAYVTGRRLLEEELRDKAVFLARATAARIEAVQRPIEAEAESLGATLDGYAALRADPFPLLEGVVRRNPGIFGSAIAGRGADAAAYVARDRSDPKRLVRKDLQANGYSPEVWDWYTLPRDLGVPAWTDAYFDEGGGDAVMVTYGVPLHGPGDPPSFAGVVTCDLSLDWLEEAVSKLVVGESGYAFLLSAKGTFLSHPRHDLIMNSGIFSLAEERGDPGLRDLGRTMLEGGEGFASFRNIDGEDCWLAYAAVPTTGWSLAVVSPKRELLGKVVSLSQYLSAVAGIGLLLLLGVSIGIARSISGPIRSLEAATRILSKGDLDLPLPVLRGKDEVGKLSRAFESMRSDLKRHIEDLRVTTSAKERMESEIHIARYIQQSLVPRTFPPYPNRKDIDLYALLDPARVVGGDFYDFFLAGENELCVAIGDVAGKGVPAALYMAVTRTLLRAHWREQTSPAATLSVVNRELTRENIADMFVTLYYARIDLSTGLVRHASGGHPGPILLGETRMPSVVELRNGPILGAIEEAEYTDTLLTLAEGEGLCLYTDGVTETLDPEGRLNGEDWVLRQMESLRTRPAADVVEGIRMALGRYRGEAEPHDDVTLLAFRRPQGPTRREKDLESPPGRPT